MTRSIFYVSDSTAMTSKSLGQSLLSQFDSFSFQEFLRPYIDTEEKVLELVKELSAAKEADGLPPIAFASMMDEKLMRLLSARIDGVIDIFAPFMSALEEMMAEKSSKAVGRAHNAENQDAYRKRIEAIDYTLATDDGLKVSDYDQADIILLGISRSGKTPTALYLALNFGLKVANFPFTADDLPQFALHRSQNDNRHKLVGLSISAERLISIRKERRPESSYASPLQISLELEALAELFSREQIPVVDSSTRSVEEIAASVMRIRFKR